MRATGSRPGAFQALCEQPARGPVRFKRYAVAERASLTLLGPAHNRSSNRLSALCVSSDKRATGARPGAFLAVCERPAHGPVRFKRRAVAERAFLTLLGRASVGRVSSPRLTGRQLHNMPRQSPTIRVSTPRAMSVARRPSQYPPVAVSTPARPGNVVHSGSIEGLRPS